MSSNAKRRKLGGKYVSDDQGNSDDYLFIPDPNDSGSDDSESNDSENDSELDEEENLLEKLENEFPPVSYSKILDEYAEDQRKLEPNHVFDWQDGEVIYTDVPENEILLKENDKLQISNSSFVETFEFFFSSEFKEYIVEATNNNGYALSMDEFDTFLGIIILSIFNKRSSQRDYWSTNGLLRCDPIASSMSRLKFLEIKSNLKLSNPEDEDPNDKAWRVRGPLEIFRKNIKRFGFFSTALSVDEMMVKFYGRTSLRQFMRNKPVRFGIKLWGICDSNGFLYDCDIYCGKGSQFPKSGNVTKLKNCCLGSRVVLQMLHKLFTDVIHKKRQKYHLYFDNFFTSPDLLVHLRRLGLRATGTVRTNRVGTTNEIDKKGIRGSYLVKHDENSGINFITVMDSKPVSLLSTTASVTPTSTVKRFSKEVRNKQDIPFPRAFKFYNQFMGGVDLHDGHCSNLMPPIRSKKWTWAILIRLIQSTITNATVLINSVSNSKKVGTKDVAMEICNHYLSRIKETNFKLHKTETVKLRKNCINFAKCSIRTQKRCIDCNAYQCSLCFDKIHKKDT